MATSKWKGPIHSVNGYYFHPAAYTDARPMTIVGTTVIRTGAASNAAATALTELCGLSICKAAWCNFRQPTQLATQVIMSAIPFGSGSTVTYHMLANIGTGALANEAAGNATVDIFMMGYVS